MQDAAVVCLKCGLSPNTPVNGEHAFCYSCGAQIDSRAAICVNCGVAQNQKAAPSPIKASSANNVNNEKITRSRDGKILAGVFAGLGKRWNMNPWVLRAISIFLNFVFIGWFIDIAYIIAIFALPMED